MLLNLTTISLRASLSLDPNNALSYIATCFENSEKGMRNFIVSGKLEDADEQDLVAAPDGNHNKSVQELRIFNEDDQAQTVTLLLKIEEETFKMFVAVLSPGYSLEYIQQKGFQIYNDLGVKL
jgi:hypothetical protein